VLILSSFCDIFVFGCKITKNNCNFAPNLHNNMEKKRKALKKLLEAVEKELLHKPDKKTLDRLSLLVGFQDWESFQEALHGEASADKNYK